MSILSANRKNNYDYLLKDIETVVFVTGGGTNDIIESIAGMIALIDYYCPSCSTIYITDNWLYNLVGGITKQEDYYLNLRSMDSRIIFFCDTLWYEELGERVEDKQLLWANIEVMQMEQKSFFYEDDDVLKWNYYSSVQNWCEPTGPVFLDKKKKMIFVNKQIGRWKENNRELFNWNSEILSNYYTNIINYYNSNLTPEFREFIIDNNIRECCGLHIRLDNWWNEIAERMFEHKDSIYCPTGNCKITYDYDKLVFNINKFSNPVEFKNSYLKNIELLIERKLNDGERIFVASDCPVTANYLFTKYYNTIQYKEYEITEWYKQWFNNGDTTSPYNRNHDKFDRTIFESKHNFLPATRCVIDYLCLLCCKEVFGSNGGIYKLLQEMGVTTNNIAIETEILENYKNME